MYKRTEMLMVAVQTSSIESAARRILESIDGEDADRQGLQKTPMRYARALEFLTKG